MLKSKTGYNSAKYLKDFVQKLIQPSKGSWLVGCFQFSGLWDSISVYIEPFPRKKEKEERKDRGE